VEEKRSEGGVDLATDAEIEASRQPLQSCGSTLTPRNAKVELSTPRWQMALR